MRSKAAVPTQGFTLIELLVAAAIGLLILTLTFALVMSARGVYNTDTARTGVNQNLRSAMNLLRDDARQAGERLPGTFPAIEVQRVGAQTEVVIRKGLTDDVLPVCYDLNAGSNTPIIIETTTAYTFFSSPLPQTSANGECPANTTATATWEGYRVDAGGALRVYVYDAITRTGTFMDVTAAGERSLGYAGVYLLRADALQVSGTWPRRFEAAKQPRVYLIEEHRYRLAADNTLQLVVNDQNDAALVQNVAGGINAMSVSAFGQGSAPQLLRSDGTLRATDDWKSLAFLRLTLTGEQTIGGKTITRTLSEDALPRNVFSR